MRKLLYIILIAAILYAFGYYQNNDLVVSKYKISGDQIPQAFDKFRIVHISDLHNKKFGEKQAKLLGEISSLSPDIIVVTGDLVDRRKYDLKRAMDFIEGALELAPVYFVSGNHEAWSGKYDEIAQTLEQAGVQILDDRSVVLEVADEAIELIGVSDPDFATSSYFEGTDSSNMEKNLKDLADASVYQILLSHRPELFNLYVSYNINLTLSGHAHGGQFRLPFIGGVIAPDQGMFPDYTSGIYEVEGSKMIVSRGLGNSIIPLRLFNRPEIVLIELIS